MKCCHITTVHPVFDVRIFHKECKTLSENGFEVILIAQHDKDEISDRVMIRSLPKAKNAIHRIFVIDVKAFWLAYREKADIYHFHDPELLFAGILLKVITGKKVIYDVHEDYEKQALSKDYIPKIVRGIVGKSIRMCELLVSKYLDGVITATEDIAHNFSLKNIYVVKNYPSVRIFTKKRICDENKKEFNIIYIGGLAEIRGTTKIVEAVGLARCRKDIKLILSGNFESKDYEDKIRSMDGFRKVSYIGWTKYDRIPELLSNCDIGLVCLLPITNYLTSLPLKLFEYMACGLPIISSNFPLWKDIVEGNHCGITVDPLKPEEIAKAIEYMADHPDKIKSMSENCRRSFLEKYNWEKESKVLLNAYEQLYGK